MSNLIQKIECGSDISSHLLSEINNLGEKLKEYFRDKFLMQPRLSRSIVSFQANKSRAVYRWYKYKEAFSASLVDFLLKRHNIKSGKILDPFAGTGTALFASSEAGISADGIELLPIGQQIIISRKALMNLDEDSKKTISFWIDNCPWKNYGNRVKLNVLRITDGAYPEETVDSIERYSGALLNESASVQAALKIALLCILESISYTRKDGQYLRWDYRSGRRESAKPFYKGVILDFDEAIVEKLKEILFDIEKENTFIELFPVKTNFGEINLFSGSSLEIMPKLRKNSYDAILTSPPYCNRYDYTRTYALELALLGIDDKEILNLRQKMLCCTVENRAKNLMEINPRWNKAIDIADEEEMLQAVLTYLESEKANGNLNNTGIPRMVRGYFYEMACIIFECSRVLKPGACMFMVNDNVRYSGASISVDMILSHIAEKLGFYIENILVLPAGKGNSSQQMGKHGREPLRKCVYVWRKL